MRVFCPILSDRIKFFLPDYQAVTKYFHFLFGSYYIFVVTLQQQQRPQQQRTRRNGIVINKFFNLKNQYHEYHKNSIKTRSNECRNESRTRRRKSRRKSH